MMHYKKGLAALAFVAVLAGCSTMRYQPVVDTKGLNMQKYQQDLTECNALADQVDPVKEGAGDALLGAGIGAAAGAALGAISGNAGAGAATGAALGGFGGGGAGAISTADRHKNILNNCLTGRGYRILG